MTTTRAPLPSGLTLLKNRWDTWDKWDNQHPCGFARPTCPKRPVGQVGQNTTFSARVPPCPTTVPRPKYCANPRQSLLSHLSHMSHLISSGDWR